MIHRSRHISTWLPLLLVLLASVPAFAVESLPVSHPTFQQVKRIYDTIANSFGTGRRPPRLLVVPGTVRPGFAVAISDAGSEGGIGIPGSTLVEGYIAIEERAVELMGRLGPDRDNGIAFLLGHELTHYYMRHGWVGDFGNAFVSTDMGKQMIKAATYEDAVKRETEADYFGGFYSFLAGYDTLSVGPRVLDALYAEYRIPDKIDNYPSRNERKAITERSAADLARLIPLFDTSTRLLVAGKYEDAGRLLSHLASIFPSREICTNAGVAYAQAAVALFRPGSVKYAYPFEFDADTRLKGNRLKTRGIDDQAEKRSQLLLTAQEWFEQAIRQDKRYATAYVNLASVQSLLGDNDQAVVTAKKGLELARASDEPATAANALAVRGIALALTGDIEGAKADFIAAEKGNQPFGGANLAVLKGNFPTVAPPGAELPGGKETIAGISPWDGLPKDRETRTYTLHATAAGQQSISILSRTGQGWDAAVVLSGNRQTAIVATLAGYPGVTARGIAIGSPAAQLLEKYGSATRIISSRQGIWHLYAKSGIAFLVNGDARVGGWLLMAAN
ncbi:hypothetical protein OR1_01749 [Geobacter sp. OR-1]|uniref:hypothetical protein n=1 Tax=Geobacter sp. OR-1 TaxID=1266765 RepID=UPI00054251D2|nr:hypothetical protein [Geobacter sp. OR-1]GAM09470.1 hypothetical protein OR1_01749 [Geobacter sp. OR-1]